MLRSPSSPAAEGSRARRRTVGEVLQALEREHPDVKGWILDERGLIREHINVFVNKEYGREDTTVGAQDRLSHPPAISGDDRD